MKFNVVLVCSTFFLLILAGCTMVDPSFNPESIIMASTQVQSLLEEYPNSDLQIVYFSVNDSVMLHDEYVEVCGRELTPKNMYRFSLQDESRGLNVVGFLDMNSQIVECIRQQSSAVVPEISQVEEESSQSTSTQNDKGASVSKDSSTLDEGKYDDSKEGVKGEEEKVVEPKDSSQDKNYDETSKQDEYKKEDSKEYEVEKKYDDSKGGVKEDDFSDKYEEEHNKDKEYEVEKEE